MVTRVVVATCIRCLRRFRLVFLEDECCVFLVAWALLAWPFLCHASYEDEDNDLAPHNSAMAGTSRLDK
jgi:hypothetical protein